MGTRRRAPTEGSWWWAAGGGVGGLTFGDVAPAINHDHRCEFLTSSGNNPLQVAGQPTGGMVEQHEDINIDSDMYQFAPYPRPRLRWTPELHDKFVKAVDELGGPTKATPKAILNRMDVQGLTLFHLKSHLQKFRLGKTGRRLWRREIQIPHYSTCCRKDEGLPPITLERQGFSNSNTSDRNEQVLHDHRINTLDVKGSGNLQQLVVPQPHASVKKLEVEEAINKSGPSITSTFKVEERLYHAPKPALLPLFPPVPACGIKDKVDYASPPLDDYLSSISCSSDIALTKIIDSRRAGLVFGSFFDEVANFSKVDDHGNDLTADDSSIAIMDDGSW